MNNRALIQVMLWQCEFLLFVFLGIAVKQSLAADEIARWRYGHDAALSLSSDDGALATVLTTHAIYYGDPRKLSNPDDPNTWGQELRDLTISDTFAAICARHGVVMTFYLDTRQVEEPPDHVPSNPSPQSPNPNPPWEHHYGFWPGDSQGPGTSGTWDNWAYAASLGHEIASHSVHHPEQGIDALHVDAPIWNGASYNTPFHAWLVPEPIWWREYLDTCEGRINRSFLAPLDELAVSKWRIEQQLRARAGTYPSLADYTVYSFSWPKGDSTAHPYAGNHYVSSRLVSGGVVNGDTGPGNWQLMSSAHVPGNDLQYMINDLNNAIAGGHWLHPVAHALGRVYCCYLNEAMYEAYVAYAAQKRDQGMLWIDTVGNVSRYLRERLDARLSVDRSRVIPDELLTVGLTLNELLSSPIAEVYNYPLTLKIDVPVDWGDVRVEQNGEVQIVTAGAGVVRFDAIPGGGTVHVTKESSAPNPADFDVDGDVDQEDFGFFQACYSGLGNSYEMGCENADLDFDDDVDYEDFNIYKACMGGANQAPDC